MLRLGAERPEIRVVNDQIGSPTYAGDLAKTILSLLEKERQGKQHSGIYHYTNEGVCSWYDFAHSIIRMTDLPAKVTPIPTREYPTAAKRPEYSVLSKEKIKREYQLEIPHWEDSLRRCLENMNVLKKQE